MRPVNKLPPVTYVPPQTLKFASPPNSGGATNPVNIVFGVNNNTPIQTTALLAKMFEFSQKANLSTNEGKAFSILKKKMATIYGNSRNDLISNLGQFCSFCGMPVYDSALAVEHTLPKKSFPNLTISYANFLLVCPSCNSKKGNKPSYTKAKAWTGKANPPLNEVEDAARNHFIWATNVDAYRSFRPNFNYKLAKDDNHYLPLTTVEYMSLGNSFIKFDGGYVVANIYSTQGNKFQKAYVRVEVLGTKTEATAMIDLIKQNDYLPDDPRLSDRRIMNLTKTWLVAMLQLNYFNQAVSSGNSALMDAFFNQILLLATSQGYYYMWVYLMNNFDNNLVTKFVQDSNNKTYYPGTNTTQVP